MNAVHGDLQQAVGRLPWSALLPSHRGDGADLPAGARRCVDVLDLAEGQWLAVVADERDRSYPVPMSATADGVRRARAGDGTGEALLARLGRGTCDVGAFSLSSWYAEPALGERQIDADQTNESLVIGERAVLKWVFLAEEGPHPAPSLLTELDRSGFTGMPRPWGLVQWRPREEAPPRLLASVVTMLPAAVDGWRWAVDDLRTAVTCGDRGVVTAAGARVGALVAQLHSALADTAREATLEELRRWRGDAEAELDHALAVTSGDAHDLLAGHAGAVRVALAELDVLSRQRTPVLRVHGDLHIGQVLRSGAGEEMTYVVTDFDGNPVVPPAERILEQPAALDVAGMAQSMRHAALVLRRHEPDHDSTTTAVMSSAMVDAFLDTYRGTLAAAGHHRLFDEQLVAPLCLRQVCREFTYAATHLPRWSYVPEAALPLLLRNLGGL